MKVFTLYTRTLQKKIRMTHMSCREIQGETSEIKANQRAQFQ